MILVIQRWQSLLLLIATVMMVLFSFCSLGQIQGESVSVNITSFGLYAEGGSSTLLLGTVYVAIVALLSALLSLLGIFMFKNTRLQKRMCLLAIVLVLAACGSEWVAVDGAEIAGSTGPSWSAVVCAPFIAIIALIAAFRFIKSDEKKLAGYDRLR